MEVHRGVWRHAKVQRQVYGGVVEGVQRNTGVHRDMQGTHRCIQECAEVHGGAQEVQKGGQRYTVVFLKCMEECIGLQSGAQRCVEVHKGYRGVCRGTQRGV